MKLKNLVLSSTAALALFAVSAKVANADTVTVKAGDTVSAIAVANHTTVDAIASANHLKNVNLVFVGDKLEVNGTTGTQTTTASSVATSQAPKTTNQATSALSVATSTSSVTASQAPKTTSQATSASSVATSASSVATNTSSVTASQATSASSVTASQAPKTTSASSTTTSQATPVSYTTSSNNGASTQSEVLSQMQSRTGVSAATWNRIITRESNWNSTVKNSTSGAYGLFQNMHISSGSTQDQVNAAVSLYQSQGMSAWGE